MDNCIHHEKYFLLSLIYSFVVGSLLPTGEHYNPTKPLVVTDIVGVFSRRGTSKQLTRSPMPLYDAAGENVQRTNAKDVIQVLFRHFVVGVWNNGSQKKTQVKTM